MHEGLTDTIVTEPALMTDMLSWIAEQPRAYSDVMNAWRTSCPRLSIWEDAVDHRFVARAQGPMGEVVHITENGQRFLNTQKRLLGT